MAAQRMQIRINPSKNKGGRTTVVYVTTVDGVPVKVVGTGKSTQEARENAQLKLDREALKIRGKREDADGSFQKGF